jgi:hypothetical protein
MSYAASIPHKTREHNNSNKWHPGNNKKEDKFVLKKQLTQTNLANNRGIRRKDKWSPTAADTKLNTAYDTFKLKTNHYN